jgi:predicted HicB family RNase H-like nuclease
LYSYIRNGQEPNKTVKGAFNVRIGSGLHLRALQETCKEGVSLNTFIKEAIEKELSHTR